MTAITAYINTHHNIQILRFLLSAKTLNMEDGCFLTNMPRTFYAMFFINALKMLFVWPIVLFALVVAKEMAKDIIEGVSGELQE